MLFALLTVAAVLWCGQMVRQFPEDLRNFKETDDGAERLVIGLLWLVTLPMLFYIGRLLWGLVVELL